MGGESIGESLLARLLLVSVSPSHPPRPPDTGSPKGALSQLEDSLRALLTEDRANASEARLWLSTGASWLEVLGAPVTRDPLLRLLPGRWTTEPQLKRREPFLRAAVRLLCEEAPAAVGRSVLGTFPHLLEQFFRARPSAAQLWFGQFAMSGIADFRFGARGLANFALNHRNEVWHLLAWEGKHPQAPVSVASKPHYFCELAVGPSVRALLDAHPQFLESAELRECIETGDVLALDYAFFVEALYERLELQNDVGRAVGAELEAMLSGLSLQRLCQALFHLLDPSDMLDVVNGLLGVREGGSGREWVSAPAALVFAVRDWRAIDDAILCHALANHSSAVQAMLAEEGQEERRGAVGALCDELCQDISRASGGASGQAVVEPCTALGAALQAWALRWRLSQLLEEEGLQPLLLRLAPCGVEHGLERRPAGTTASAYPMLRERQKLSGKERRSKKKHKRGSRDKAKSRKKRRRRSISSSDSSGESAAEENGRSEDGSEGVELGRDTAVSIRVGDFEWLSVRGAEVPDRVADAALSAWRLGDSRL